jgi:16S rRNA processing protein RimM
MSRPANNGVSEKIPITIGKISGIYGVSGWLRVISYTRPRQNIFLYTAWLVGKGSEWVSRELVEGRQQGKGLVARIEGLDDRDNARMLIGREIAVYRSQMPDLPEGEYYWCDLMQMEVVNLQGDIIGKVSEVLETGANDVLVVTGEHRHLIPLIFDHYVIRIEQDTGRIVVDWDPRA